MKRFSIYLAEASQPGKNLHMEHIEDEILNHGVPGGRAAINFIQALRDMFAGSSSGKVDISVKWDGAPAIFAGTDPADGKFFVSSKGAFNKTPKLVKKPSDVKMFSPGLQPKLLLAFKHLSKLGIKGVIQGDMMFTSSDLETNVIDGEDFLTYQPNTIVYAVPAKSALAKTFKRAKIGVVFHTTYVGGPALADMKASFGVNISGFKKTPDVWFEIASCRYLSGKVLFTKKETATITAHLSKAGKSFQKINSRALDEFLAHQEKLISSSASGSSFKTYNNSKVRAGQSIGNPSKHAKEYLKYFESYWRTKVIDKVKTPKVKAKKEQDMKESLKAFSKAMPTIRLVSEYQSHILSAKHMIARKLDTGARRMQNTFIRTENGFKVTPDEGYVVIDRLKGNAVKIVDRMEFSFNNFNAIKAWDR